MNLFKKSRIAFVGLLLMGMASSCSDSDSNMRERNQNQSRSGQEVSSSVGEAYDKTKRELCQMVNGKLECAKEEIKSNVQDIGD